MSDGTVAGPGTSLFSSSMSYGEKGDELAILPIAAIDFVSLLAFFPLVCVFSDHLVTSVALHMRVLPGCRAGTSYVG
jgi:hypothetical protein